MAGEQLVCGVCSSGEPRYRCPRCLTRYCSCDCYRNHKQEEGRCRDPDVPAPAETGEEPEYRYPTPDTVPPERLCRLRDSEAVRETLRNRNVRALLRDLDRSRDPTRMLDSLMREPIFVEFVNACLDAVGVGED
ncbi:zinc finger HIT domain-containing protein 3 [Dermacentor andersoni]|uniref:zinc finger HIT domain-containing protein 3 n=1 Tax=Dermacentor andersoni TaxID=34620 RepID=UPI00215596F0|nr:zinc finger HIT domain-containing protein 3-like [Dermacentor andersoni]